MSVLTNLSQLPFPQASGETSAGFSTCDNMAKLGYLTINPFPAPTPTHVSLDPQIYACGFGPSGKIIGANVHVPNPAEVYRYHVIPFPRGVDWSQCVDSLKHDPDAKRKQSESGHEERKGVERGSSRIEEMTNTPTLKKTGATEPEQLEIDEYFTAGNDEGYRMWEEKQFGDDKAKRDKYHDLNVVESDVTTTLGNIRQVVRRRNAAASVPATRQQTSSQKIGQYNNLAANYITSTDLLFPRFKKPVKAVVDPVVYTPNTGFLTDSLSAYQGKRSTITDTHNFAYQKSYGALSHPDREQLDTIASNIASTSLTLRGGEIIGFREKGYTFPLYTKTGLEINRPTFVGSPAFSAMGKEPPHRYMQRAHPTGKKPDGQRKAIQTFVPYCIPPRECWGAGSDNGSGHKPSNVIYACVRVFPTVTP